LFLFSDKAPLFKKYGGSKTIVVEILATFLGIFPLYKGGTVGRMAVYIL